MNTLLPATVMTWENYGQNEVVSQLIVNNLVTIQNAGNNNVSPDKVEMDPIENQLNAHKKDNVFTAIFDRVSKSLRASA